MSGINKRIKEAVRKSGLSFDEIEEKLELPQGKVSAYVTGKEEPDTETVKRLAPILGTSADRLLFGVEKIGEMKAMFPNDATPASTPMSDWRFLIGVITLFVGAGGAMLMYMMYSPQITELSMLFDVLGWPMVLLLTIGAVGLILCIVSLVMSMYVPKKKKNKKDKK